MLKQYLNPEERKVYKQGDYISYSKEADTKSKESRYLKERWERMQEEPNYYDSVHRLICAYCNDVFYSQNERKKYCSQRCVNDAYMSRRKERQKIQRTKKCPVCGMVFIGKSKKAVFCSQSCKQKQYRTRCKNVT